MVGKKQSNVFDFTLPELKELKSLVAPKVHKGKPIFRKLYLKLIR
jgi:hypothetical protein